VFQWHPELQIGFAYAPTLIMFEDPVNTKGARLQEDVIRCINKIISAEK
jgi:hypothetical protein